MKETMKFYQIGGSVRDELLGYVPHDIDYVVIHGTPEKMKQKGFHLVGKTFPVFLHPKTREEYALARRAVPKDNGHIDYIFDETVTLEEDTKWRDFTINGLVRDPETDKIIDYVNGQKDITNKIIRHINDMCFASDPLRIIRMCRLSAELLFEIDPTTMELARKEVKQLNKIYPERIWTEIQKALKTKHFDLFIQNMRTCGAMKFLFPDIEKLWDTPEKLEYHPEGNSGDHMLLTIQASQQDNPYITFALLLHDIGKAETPRNILPAHHAHDVRGIKIINKICRQYKIPNKYRWFALLCCKNHMKFRHVLDMRLGTLYDFLKDVTHNFKELDVFENFVEVCRCDTYGRAKAIDKTEIDQFTKQAEYCRKKIKKIMNVNITAMPNFKNLFTDENIGIKIREYIIQQLRNE